MLLTTVGQSQRRQVLVAVADDLVSALEAVKLPLAEQEDVVHPVGQQAHVAEVPLEVLGADASRRRHPGTLLLQPVPVPPHRVERRRAQLGVRGLGLGHAL